MPVNKPLKMGLGNHTWYFCLGRGHGAEMPQPGVHEGAGVERLGQAGPAAWTWEPPGTLLAVNSLLPSLGWVKWEFRASGGREEGSGDDSANVGFPLASLSLPLCALPTLPILPPCSPSPPAFSPVAIPSLNSAPSPRGERLWCL